MPMFIWDHHWKFSAVRSKEKEMNTMHRWDQGITKVRNDCPIETEDAHAQASVHSKQGIDNSIVGSNPAHPVEHAQSCEKITGDPVPNETAG